MSAQKGFFMSIIYEPKGKALEYSPLAANLYKGCGHGCKYCFAPKATFTDREIFSSDEYITPRPNVLELLKKDAVKIAGDRRPILLSFTSDAYQQANEKYKITRMSLYTLFRNNLKVCILTKGGLRACNDFDILEKNKGNTFAVTLTTDDPAESLDWEPRAALPIDRIESLKIAHKRKIKTWVSFEPVINPDAVLRLISETYTFVDLYKVGKLNYHPFEKTINWKKFLYNVEAVLDKYHCKRYIKKDLEAYRNK